MSAPYLHHYDSKADCHANKGQRYINTSSLTIEVPHTPTHPQTPSPFVRLFGPFVVFVVSSARRKVCSSACPFVRSSESLLICLSFCPLVVLSALSARPLILLYARRFVRSSAPHGLISLIGLHSRNKKMERPNGALHPQTQLAKYESKNKANWFWGNCLLLEDADNILALLLEVCIDEVFTTILDCCIVICEYE